MSIRGRICEIMNFDENKKTYTIERGKKIMDNRKKLAEEKIGVRIIYVTHMVMTSTMDIVQCVMCICSQINRFQQG